MKFDMEHHPRERLTAVVFLMILAVFFVFFVMDLGALKMDALTRYQDSLAAQAGSSGGAELTIGRKLELAVDSVEQSVNEKIRYRENFIELHGLTQKIMAKDVIYDYNYGSIYKTNYGQITSTVNRAEVDADLNGMRQLKAELDALDEDTALLYIQAPFKLPEHEQQLPVHVREYANDNANRFLVGLEEAGIDAYDLRPEFFSSGMTQNQLFYDTDHHWTIEAALYSTGLIAERLTQDYGFEIDPSLLDPKRYEFKIYEDFFLGAMGRRVGKLYSGVDDFTVITPNFETFYTVTEKDAEPAVVLEGSFEEAVIVQSYLDLKAPVDTNRYAAYHGDHAELILTNHLVDQGRILMIKDSFGLPVYSFLSLGVHEIRALDVRLYKGTISEYVKIYQPDVVIVLYNPNSLASSMFEFSGN
jgi:hypothetical protein